MLKRVARALFPVLAFLVLSGLSARAAIPGARAPLPPAFTQASVQARWLKYFPSQARLPDPRNHLELLVRDPEQSETPARCLQLQVDIAGDLFAYGLLASKSKSSDASTKGQKILDQLRGLERTGDSCFEVAARTYIAGTLALLDPSSDSDAFYPVWTFQGRPLPYGIGITLLGASLLNRKRPDGSPAIVLLTGAERNALAHDASDPLWNQTRGKLFSVSAGFDCLSTQIYLDPFLAPFNEAATFIHEMDHLFRDRMMGADVLPAPPETLAQTDLRAYLLMDETLAIGLSAYYQRHLRWMSLWSPGNFIRLGHYRVPFLVNGDLSLFRRRGGPIAEIWHLLENSKGRESQFDPASGLLVLGETLLLNHPRYLNQRLTSDEALSAVMEIYRIVFKGYFPKENFDPELASRVAPEKHDLSLAPLSLWLNAHDAYYDTNAKQTIPAGDWTLEGDVVTTTFDSLGVWKGTRLKISLDAFFDGLDTLFGRLDSPAPTPACALYLKALQSHDKSLGSYQGARLSTAASSGPGAIIPGETGVKGGETGVKGEQLVRPCLDLGDEL